MCLNDQILSSYIDGELSEPWKTQVEEHLTWCKSCQERLEHIKSVQKMMNDSVLEDTKIEDSKDRVLRYITNNVINNKKHTFKQKVTNVFQKKLMYPVLAAAVSFCFCLIIFNPGKTNEILQPMPSTTINIDSIVPVRTTDNYTTIQTLDRYSLEEILQYLDSEGFDVTLKTKGLTPINGEVIINNEEIVNRPDYTFKLLYSQPDTLTFDLHKYKFITP